MGSAQRRGLVRAELRSAEISREKPLQPPFEWQPAAPREFLERCDHGAPTPSIIRARVRRATRAARSGLGGSPASA